MFETAEHDDDLTSCRITVVGKGQGRIHLILTVTDYMPCFVAVRLFMVMASFEARCELQLLCQPYTYQHLIRWKSR